MGGFVPLSTYRKGRSGANACCLCLPLMGCLVQGVGGRHFGWAWTVRALRLSGKFMNLTPLCLGRAVHG